MQIQIDPTHVQSYLAFASLIHSVVSNELSDSEGPDQTLRIWSLLSIYARRHVFAADLGVSVGCAVRLETRRSRVQPPPRPATFFRGD